MKRLEIRKDSSSYRGDNYFAAGGDHPHRLRHPCAFARRRSTAIHSRDTNSGRWMPWPVHPRQFGYSLLFRWHAFRFQSTSVFLTSDSVATTPRFPRPGPPEQCSPASSVLSRR